ncbi:MAG: N-methylhydantoinase [Solirubrobacterales bacterium]|jgi:N-methylhydantoinase A|nr:N-methylhydantoinase [Solirubrobacterales bacterium]
MTTEQLYNIGVDIGGTFTDTIVVDGNGSVSIGKDRSTPPEFQEGFLLSLESAADRLAITLRDLLTNAAGVYHGMTIGTNALVEGRTAKVGLLATSGLTDNIFIMRAGHRLNGLAPEEIARPAGHVKPDPLVPKHLVEAIPERITFDGEILVGLNEEAARASINRLVEQGVEAFAVSLMWSVVNPVHEQRLAELIREIAPDAFVSVSSEVVRRTGEYERTVAAVINALIGPVMNQYLGKLTRELVDHGYPGTLWIMSSSGGVIDADYARTLPLLTIDSGPVGGLIGSGALTRASAAESANGKQQPMVDVITTDMGGTTFDVGVIRRGEPLTRTRTKYKQYDYFLPTLDVRAVGAGGGSIIRYDEMSSSFRVGPKSAGATPGPAAYQRGGELATVTDADLVVGYLNPDFFLGGRLSLSMDAAEEALEKVGSPLGMSAEETAAAAVRIVDNQMADAIRLASVQQGYDPRGYTMYAYGGAGPVHGTALAAALGISRVLVPLSDLASGWSAFGVVSADSVVVEELSKAMQHPFSPDEFNAGWSELEGRVLKAMERQGIDPSTIQLERSIDMRYGAQINVMPVSAPAGEYDESDCAELVRLFENEYERIFGAGVGYPGAGYVVTALTVRGRAPRTDFSLARREVSGEDRKVAAAKKSERGVIFYEHGLDRVPTPVYDGAGLFAGAELEGPAILEFVDTTIVLRHEQRAALDAFGSLSIDL